MSHVIRSNSSGHAGWRTVASSTTRDSFARDWKKKRQARVGFAQFTQVTTVPGCAAKCGLLRPHIAKKHTHAHRQSEYSLLKHAVGSQALHQHGKVSPLFVLVASRQALLPLALVQDLRRAFAGGSLSHVGLGRATPLAE